MNEIFFDLLFLGIGILIGIGLRNDYAEKKESKTFEQIDEEVRNDLAVTKNLNKSLLEDVHFLREKLKRLSH